MGVSGASSATESQSTPDVEVDRPETQREVQKPDVESSPVTTNEQTNGVTGTPLDPNSAIAERNLLDPRRLYALAQPEAAPNGTHGAQPVAAAAVNPTAPVEASSSLNLNPKQRALLSLDLAADRLNAEDSAGAARILQNAARTARQDAANLDARSADARFLNAFADNADARARSYQAGAPRQMLTAAGDLASAGWRANQTAADLERQGHRSDARLLRAIGTDSSTQASMLQQRAISLNVLSGEGVAQAYQQIVNASFDKQIAEASNWKWPWQDASPRDKLIADKQKMQVVFSELNRTMEEQGVSMDRAWNMMFEDNRVDGWKSAPRVPGFATRNDAATFLRDNEVTRHLLSPFADIARGLSDGDARTIDQAREQLVDALRGHDQWNIARAVLDDFRKNAGTPEGRDAAARLDANESREWWKAKAADFAQHELPILLLSTAISGGVGTGARALALAAGWSARAARVASIATELGAFVPTERVLNEAINGRKADWSATALGRDYALTLATFGTFKALGLGWRALRGSGFGRDIIPGLKGSGETVELATPEGVRVNVGRRELEEAIANPMETRSLRTGGGYQGPWPPEAPVGPKPGINEPGGAEFRYRRYVFDKYREGKTPAQILSRERWESTIFRPAAAGGRPGRPGGASQVAVRQQLANEEGFINTENTRLGQRTIRGRTRDNMVDMYKRNELGGTDYVEVDDVLNSGIPRSEMRAKLRSELPALGPNDRLIYIDKTNAARRIIYNAGEDISVVDTRKATIVPRR